MAFDRQVLEFLSMQVARYTGDFRAVLNVAKQALAKAVDQVTKAASTEEMRAALPLTPRAIQDAAISANLGNKDLKEVTLLRELTESAVLLLLVVHQLQ